MQVEFTTHVACRPEHLWRFIEDPELQMQWMKGLVSNELTSDPPGREGSTFRMHIREGGRVRVYDGEILSHRHPEHLAVRFGGGSFPEDMRMQVDYHLARHADGTRLDYSARMVAGRIPLPMRLFMPLMRIFTRWQLTGFMRTLKRLAEADVAEA